MTLRCTNATAEPGVAACTSFLTLAKKLSDGNAHIRAGLISALSDAICSKQWFLMVKLNNLAALWACTPNSTMAKLYWLMACWKSSKFWPVSLSIRKMYGVRVFLLRFLGMGSRSLFTCVGMGSWCLFSSLEMGSRLWFPPPLHGVSLHPRKWKAWNTCTIHVAQK